tara:strand:+ start:248 stop:595 length:348 start_codon:yes stop_codon:yes gene_type:complete
MNIQSVLNDNSFQIAVTSSLVFLVVAFPPLFKFVDRIIAKTFGKRVGSNYYTVLLIHAVVVGVLMFLFTSYILKPVFKMLTTHDVAKRDDKKPDESKNILEKFSVGGKMTCGGGK